MAKAVKARYRNGVLEPLEPLDLRDGEEVVVKIINVEERRKAIRKYRGVLGPASKELLDKFMLEAEEQQCCF